ncbi:DUF3105 domain-containing protein [Candidatus Saccharibacteria bacterium]|nr:DUF3105 domain-containing protein [Candidatus Saccharibacteria bacterium]
MSNKIFYAIMFVLILSFTGFAVLNKDSSSSKVPEGQKQPDKGRQHLAQGQTFNYSTVFPTSGTHAEQPAPWAAYKQEIPNEIVVHNMEHGGLVISYRPDMPKATIEKLEKIFSKPYSNPKFTPSKAIVMPGSKNDRLIIIRSWNRILKLDSYNEKTLTDYYLKNVNKSPEPGAA